jgi:putative ABC transport system permease protein
LDFQSVAFLRRDFATPPFGGLLNDLALDRSAVIVSRSFLATQNLSVGDRFTATVNASPSKAFDMTFLIRGTADLFPTLYPEQNGFFVANLDYLFEQMGGLYPYNVLLRLAPDANTGTVVANLKDQGFLIQSVQDARALISQEQQRPERQGILGFLSIGFLASAVLTVTGYLFYSFVAFRGRFIEVGILRAIGVSARQVILFLTCEQVVLIGTGIGAGTGIGILASYLFIPFLQVRGGDNPQVPPFIVQIAWNEIIIVCALFTLTLICVGFGLIWLLARMRIATVVKMGESL